MYAAACRAHVHARTSHIRAIARLQRIIISKPHTNPLNSPLMRIARHSKMNYQYMTILVITLVARNLRFAFFTESEVW